MDEEPRYIVKPVTQLALFQLGYRFLIVGPSEKVWGWRRTLEEAREHADRLNHPPRETPRSN